MVLVALALTATGLLVGLLGTKLFRVLLPLLGLVSGTAVGFVGFQGVFGTGAVSTTVAVFVAVVVGLMLAILSFLFFDIAVAVFAALVGASILSYLGLALGLGDNGFVMFLLSVAGFIIGLSAATQVGFTEGVVVAVTALAGTALMLAGIFLIAGDVTLNQLSQDGVIASVLEVVDQSFLWLFAWLGGSLILMQAQRSLMDMDVLSNSYQFEPKK